MLKICKFQLYFSSPAALQCVVIETLPSSNVRISQYECFEEHNVMRWMGVPSFIKPGDVPIMVSLGSGDPGIFAGNLKGEFYQLYAVLRKHGLLDIEALRHVATVNEGGQQYRFTPPRYELEEGLSQRSFGCEGWHIA